MQHSRKKSVAESGWLAAAAWAPGAQELATRALGAQQQERLWLGLSLPEQSSCAQGPGLPAQATWCQNWFSCSKPVLTEQQRCHTAAVAATLSAGTEFQRAVLQAAVQAQAMLPQSRSKSMRTITEAPVPREGSATFALGAPAL